MAKKIALISGITGQDGAYLANFLLKKDYIVHGIRRRSSVDNLVRINKLFQSTSELGLPLYLHDGDMTDMSSILSIIELVQPDEIYNLAAQSFVKSSFHCPEYTTNTCALGTLRFLEAIKILKSRAKFYQASSSELYGKVQEIPQTEKTPFYPISPYAIAKLYGYWSVVNFREAYGMFATNGILFNHESPLRGEEFVTRKITKGVCHIALGLQNKIELGNLNARRDWGHAKDYVESMWKMMQHPEPSDWVIATGKAYSVRDFLQFAFEEIGITINFLGMDRNEKGYIVKIDKAKFYNKVGTDSIHLPLNKMVVEINPSLYRPTEVDLLIGDATKAKKLLGWAPTYTLEQIIQEMIISEFLSLGLGRQWI